MKKILIATNNQFGYHTDIYKYCEFLGVIYQLEVLCCNNNLPIVVNKNIKVHYLNSVNKFIKRIEYGKKIIEIAKGLNPDIIFIDYFIGCSFLKLLLGNNYVYNLDIRTGAISSNKVNRTIKNLILKFECKLFSNISIISKGLQKKLHISSNKVHYLPLGADLNKKVTARKVIHTNINMVYVGTLFERNIQQTILGTKYFIDKYFAKGFTIFYNIIGSSPISNDEEFIKKYINDLNLTGVIKIHGRLDYNTALEFISKADIGISYIPITEYFNFQPPTKTFEYLLSGIPCLATNTFENAQIINNINGILIKDTPEGFCNGLYELINKIEQYNYDEIINSAKNFTWENIIFNNLEPYLLSLCNKSK